jgi:hypothetical protein
VGEWYYIGHYGQLGPLTREQIDELIMGGVIARDTYVWKNGMADWVFAERSPELQSNFRLSTPPGTPPPQPGMSSGPVSTTTAISSMPSAVAYDYGMTRGQPYYPAYSGLRSDRSRTAAGILQLFLPGVGRMYLGYLAYGVLQLALAVVTCGILHVWSFIDGIMILAGGVTLDGYGRQIGD